MSDASRPLMIPDSPDSPPPLSINDPSSHYTNAPTARSPPKHSSLGKRDAQRALSSVRFNAPPSPNTPQPPSPTSPTTIHSPTQPPTSTTQYGSSGESRPLFVSLHNAQQRGKQWLKRTRRALTLSSINLGDGSRDNSRTRQEMEEGRQKSQSVSGGQYAVIIRDGGGGGSGEAEEGEGEDETDGGEMQSAYSPPSRLRIASLLGTPNSSTPASPTIASQPASSSSLAYSRSSSVSSSAGSSNSTNPSSSSTSAFHRSLASFAAFLNRHALLAPLTDPTGEYRRFWLLLIFVCLLYNAISVPLRLSFKVLYDDWHTIAALTCVDYLTDFVFLLDVGLYFYTPYLSDGILERDAKAIKHHYLVSWFWPDLVASFPFDLVALSALPLRKALPLRLTRYDQYFSVWEQYSTRFPQLIRFSKLILGMMLILHWLACMWFACGYWRGFGSTVWLPMTGIDSSSLSTQYVYAFWWATNIVTQVGGDPGLPSNDAERLMDLLLAFLSVFVVAVVIGNVNELVSELNAQESALREKLATLNHFMITRRLPSDLQQRIRSYYLTIWVRRGGVDDAAIMEELPNTLRTEISLVMNQDILGKVPIFASSSTGFIHSLVQHLKLQTYGPKELIVREGDIGSEMYFVSRGQVNVIVGDRVVGTIGSGGFFGEIAVLQDMAVRTASIEAVNYCDLFVLTHDDMSNLFKNFPAEKQIILHVADTRRAKDLLRRQLNDEKLLMREKVSGGIADTKLVQLLLDLFKPIAMGAGADLRHDHGQGNSGHVSDDDSGDNSEAGGGGGGGGGSGQRVLHEHGLYEAENGELIDLEHYGVIFSQHQSADTLYFIGKGAVDILSYPPDTSPRADTAATYDEPVEPTVVCRLTEGMFFGCILLDGEYRVSAVIPYEFHQDTIVFALTFTDLPALHAYYDAILEPKQRSRTKRVLNTLLRRYQTETDYRMALTPLPSPLSSRGGSERELRARDVTPKRLGALIRVVSRSARHSRRSTMSTGGRELLSDSEEDEDEEEDEAEGGEVERVEEEKRAVEEREEKSDKADNARRRPSEVASATAPTIITISAATETTPLTATTTSPLEHASASRAPQPLGTTTPPPPTAPTATTEPIPAFSASLLQTTPASLLGNLSADLSSPLGRTSASPPPGQSPLRSLTPPHSPSSPARTHLLRSTTDTSSSDVRRRSLSSTPLHHHTHHQHTAPLTPPIDAAGGRLRSHSVSVEPSDGGVDGGGVRGRSTSSSQQPTGSLSPRQSSETTSYKRAVAPFNFLLHMHDPSHNRPPTNTSVPPSPLTIATRLPQHRRQTSGGVHGGGGGDLSPSPLSPADVSPRSPGGGTRRMGAPTSPVMAGVSVAGSVSGRVQFLERALNGLTNDELVLLCNKATMKLYGRLQQQQEEKS